MTSVSSVSIFGIGRLGLCMGLCLERAGFKVTGVDNNADYVLKINNKTLISYEPRVEDYIKQSSNFQATTSINKGLENSLIFIVVPTPNGGGDRFYDHSILSNLLEQFSNLNVKNKHLVICCTVMPGYIDNIGREIIKNCEGCTLSYHPEFIAQGDIINGYTHPDFVLIGEGSAEAGDMIEYVSRRVTCNNPSIKRMTPLEAEITKISVNGFITTKIAYANLIGDTCTEYGVNPDVVLDAIGSDSRIGNKYLKYGYSYGGPCFPRDTMALSQAIESVGLRPRIVKSVQKCNNDHIEYQAECQLEYQLDELQLEYQVDKRQTDCQVRNYKFTDVCYKEKCTVPIIEHSAKLKIAHILAKKGYNVVISDRSHVIKEVVKEYGNIFQYEII